MLKGVGLNRRDRLGDGDLLQALAQHEHALAHGGETLLQLCGAQVIHIGAGVHADFLHGAGDGEILQIGAGKGKCGACRRG